MPGGKRTGQISRRDVEVLEFIARFGVVPRSAVATWALTGQTATLTREHRLREVLLQPCAKAPDGLRGVFAACDILPRRRPAQGASPLPLRCAVRLTGPSRFASEDQPLGRKEFK